MKSAVNQWCFPEGTPLEIVFKQSQEAGLEGVELNLYDSGSVGLTMDSSPAEATAIRRLATDHNIELKSLSTGLLWGAPLSDPDPDRRAKGRQIVTKQLELASELEMDAILVVPGAVTPHVPYETCYERSQTELAGLAKTAERLGVRIGIENVWNKFLLSPLDMVRYIDDFASKFVGAYFDVGNVLQFGFPEQWIHYLGRRIVKVHVKDFSTAVGNITGFVPLLAGDVNWDAVRQALIEVGYDDYLTAELSPYQQYSAALIADTARHIKTIIAG